MRKEAKKTALSTIAVATAKTQEQETILRTRETMAARQEQSQAIHEKVIISIASVKSSTIIY